MSEPLQGTTYALMRAVEAADETATSNYAASYARWAEDREVGCWAMVPGASVHRDSDALARSNHRVILADLRERFGEDIVTVESASHWAVGWTEAAFVPVGWGPGAAAYWAARVVVTVGGDDAS